MNGTKYYSCLSDEEKNETWDFFFLKCNKVKQQVKIKVVVWVLYCKVPFKDAICLSKSIVHIQDYWDTKTKEKI